MPSVTDVGVRVEEETLDADGSLRGDVWPNHPEVRDDAEEDDEEVEVSRAPAISPKS